MWVRLSKKALVPDILTSDDFSELERFPSYRGVFAHDQLKHKLKANECGIINLDESTGPGTHWTCWFNSTKPNQSKEVYYYDSFGIGPDNRTIKFLKGANKPIAYNTSQMQDLSSKRCGWYCLTWLRKMLSGSSFYDSLYDEFTQVPSKVNERLVKS